MEVTDYAARLCRDAVLSEVFQGYHCPFPVQLRHTDKKRALGSTGSADAFSMPQIQRGALATANKHVVCGRKTVFVRAGKTKQNATMAAK